MPKDKGRNIWSDMEIKIFHYFEPILSSLLSICCDYSTLVENSGVYIMHIWRHNSTYIITATTASEELISRSQIRKPC